MTASNDQRKQANNHTSRPTFLQSTTLNNSSSLLSSIILSPVHFIISYWMQRERKMALNLCPPLTQLVGHNSSTTYTFNIKRAKAFSEIKWRRRRRKKKLAEEERTKHRWDFTNEHQVPVWWTSMATFLNQVHHHPPPPHPPQCSEDEQYKDVITQTCHSIIRNLKKKISEKNKLRPTHTQKPNQTGQFSCLNETKEDVFLVLIEPFKLLNQKDVRGKNFPNLWHQAGQTSQNGKRHSWAHVNSSDRDSLEQQQPKKYFLSCQKTPSSLSF